MTAGTPEDDALQAPPGQYKRLARRDAVALGQAIRRRREKLGISQEELGRRADMHRNYIGALERGESNPTFRLVLQVCHGLRITPTTLIAAFERLQRQEGTR